MGLPVNLGCGNRFRQGWLNLDLGSNATEVVPWDLRRGLPIASGTAPFVYSSHMLEHLKPRDAEHVLRDVLRALRPGGIVRVVVPDLEALAGLYSRALQQANERPKELEWARIQLFDQMVRGQNGGEMLAFLREASAEERKHAIDQMGPEAEGAPAARREGPRGPSQWLAKLGRPRRLARALARLRLASARRAVGALLGSRGLEAFDLGWFDTTGERHLWMYDVHNLSEMLRRCGFARVEQQSPETSLWESWPKENLDVESDGSVSKPNSLFMEGVKR